VGKKLFPQKVLTGTKSRIFSFLILGAGVTPAEGSVKPTAGFTFNNVISPYLIPTGVCPSTTLLAIIAAVDRGTIRIAFARTQLNHPEITLGCFPNASSATRTTFSAGSP
jgi:hypothetical protein